MSQTDHKKKRYSRFLKYRSRVRKVKLVVRKVNILPEGWF